MQRITKNTKGCPVLPERFSEADERSEFGGRGERCLDTRGVIWDRSERGIYPQAKRWSSRDKRLAQARREERDESLWQELVTYEGARPWKFTKNGRAGREWNGDALFLNEYKIKNRSYYEVNIQELSNYEEFVEIKFRIKGRLLSSNSCSQWNNDFWTKEWIFRRKKNENSMIKWGFFNRNN